MSPVTTGYERLVARAEALIQTLSVEEARTAQSSGALMVDLRDVREIKREGKMPGSYHVPRGMLEFWIDPQSPYYNEVFGEDREFILSCASGGRSALSTKTLQDMGLPRVAHIETGFAGWKEDGMPISDYDTYRAERD